MDTVALQIAIISTFSPILLVLGILYLISTANVHVSALVLNLLTATVGGLHFSFDLSQPYPKILTFLFVFFLVLALTADVQWGRRFLALKVKEKKVPARRVKIESQNAWVVYKNPGDRMLYGAPKSFLERHSDYIWSDLRFRITCDCDVNPVEGKFTINEKSKILLPEDLLSKLQKSQMIRFEILE